MPNLLPDATSHSETFQTDSGWRGWFERSEPVPFTDDEVGLSESQIRLVADAGIERLNEMLRQEAPTEPQVRPQSQAGCHSQAARHEDSVSVAELFAQNGRSLPERRRNNLVRRTGQFVRNLLSGSRRRAMDAGNQLEYPAYYDESWYNSDVPTDYEGNPAEAWRVGVVDYPRIWRAEQARSSDWSGRDYYAEDVIHQDSLGGPLLFGLARQIDGGVTTSIGYKKQHTSFSGELLPQQHEGRYLRPMIIDEHTLQVVEFPLAS